MSLSLVPCPEGRTNECVGVFANSSIWDRYFAGGDSLQRSLQTAAGRGELWCALDADDNIAGVMRIVPRGFCGLYHYLALIGVAPGARGQGVGRYMMGEFERMAAADGCRRASLLVSGFNEGARRFYRSLGYWELGVIPGASREGIDEHVMLKDLVPKGAEQ